ncbi:MAG: hypothetical protein QOC81_1260 [Thermoanaerobaculia bacterium]|jgi:hypothetical protein|nr:hypothetical protein [Thermoanaerobaculia bacterium]
MKQILLKFFPERPFDGDGHGHITMATRGEDIEFEVLGEHWHNVLKGAVESLHSEGKLRVYWGSIGASYVAFPIVYNYRHVVELYLKGILLAGEPALLLAGQPGLDDGVFKEHSFGKLRPDIERIFDLLKVQYYADTVGFQSKKDFRRLLADLDAMEIRYPIDKNRRPSLENKFMTFNLFEFAQVMDKILDTLNSILSWIRYEVDARCEMAAESY